MLFSFMKVQYKYRDSKKPIIMIVQIGIRIGPSSLVNTGSRNCKQFNTLVTGSAQYQAMRTSKMAAVKPDLEVKYLALQC